MNGRNDQVWLHHDELDRTIPAVRSQVPHLGAAGWYEVDPPPEPKPKPKPKKTGSDSAPKPNANESAPSRRARPDSEQEKDS